MVIDNIKNFQTYSKLNTRFIELFNFIKKTDFNMFDSGRYEPPISGVYFLVNEYNTKSENLNILEAHHQFLDVQVMLKGEEIIEFETLDDHEIIKEYDKENDYLLLKPKTPANLILKSNMFAVFFPQDLHMPGYAYNGVSSVFKIVFKVLID